MKAKDYIEKIYLTPEGYRMVKFLKEKTKKSKGQLLSMTQTLGLSLKDIYLYYLKFNKLPKKDEKPKI